MRTRTIIMVVVTGIAFLAGCTRDEVAPEIDKTIPPEIDEGIVTEVPVVEVAPNSSHSPPSK